MCYNYVRTDYLKNETQHRPLKAGGFCAFDGSAVARDFPKRATISGRTRTAPQNLLLGKIIVFNLGDWWLVLKYKCLVWWIHYLQFQISSSELGKFLLNILSDFKNLFLYPVMLLSLFGSYRLNMLIVKDSKITLPSRRMV